MVMTAMHVRRMGMAMVGTDVRMRAVERDQHQAEVRQQAEHDEELAHGPSLTSWSGTHNTAESGEGSLRNHYALDQEIHEHPHARRKPGVPDIQRMYIFAVGLDEILQ